MKSSLNQSTSMTSLDAVDGLDDFESEVSSSEENTAISRTHSQSQKKSVKSGEFSIIVTIIKPSSFVVMIRYSNH